MEEIVLYYEQKTKSAKGTKKVNSYFLSRLCYQGAACDLARRQLIVGLGRWLV